MNHSNFKFPLNYVKGMHIVLIVFYGNQGIAVNKRLSNKKGQVLLFDAWIDEFDFFLFIFIMLTRKRSAGLCS